MKNIFRLLSVLVILGILLVPLIAHADITTPDTVAIETARCWRHMLEPNDVLIIARYNIDYGNLSSQPYQDITQTFYFTYTDSLGNVTGNETAYPFFNLGYAKGLVAFYWAGNETDADTPAWGDLGNITVTGTSLFTSPPSATYTLTADDWTAGTQPSSQREDIRQWLLNQLIFLELDWNNWYADQGYTDRQVSLVASLGVDYTYADTSGEAYLGLTVDGITDMVPLLFMGSTTAVTHTEREWTLAQQNVWEAIHEGDAVGNATEALSDLMGGIGRIWASTVLIIVGCLAIIIACATSTFGNRLNNGLLIAYVIILLSTPEGLFQTGLMALFAVIAVIYEADIFLSKRQA